MYFKQILVFLLGFGCGIASASNAFSAHENTIRLTQNQHEWSIASVVPWFSTDNPQVKPEQALTRLKNSPKSQLPGMSMDSVWLLIPFESSLPSGALQRVWISKSNAFLHYFNLYLFDSNEQLIHTDSLGINSDITYQRPPVQRHSSAFIVEGSQKYQLLVEIKSSTPMGNNITLRTEQSYQSYLSEEQIIFAVMVTILLAMFVFNTVIYIGYPDRAYFWFLVFHVGLFLYIASTYGIGHHFFNPGIIQFAGAHVMVTNFILLLLLYLFSHHFLNSFDHSYWQKFQLNHHRVITLLLVCMMTSFWVLDHIMLPVLMVVQAFVITIISVRSILFYSRGFRPALLLLITLIIQSIGAGINVAMFLYLIPENILTQKAFFISSMAELLLIAYAISVKTRYLEKEKIRLGQVDQLTGVVNVTYVESSLTTAWPPLMRGYKKMAIINIRFTGFEEFSRTIGPSEADILIAKMVARLDRNLLQVDGTFPFPGTTHYLCAQTKNRYLALVTTDSSIEDVMSDLKALMDRIIDRQNQTGSIDFRMGYYHCTNELESLDEALRKAMVALTLADVKTERIASYDSSLDDQFKLAGMVKRELHSAIKNGNLKAYAQPQLNIMTNEVIGAEVLVRWIHPERGFIPPSVFIPLTEQLNLVTEVSRFMLAETYSYLAENPNLNMSFSVNLSAKDLMVDGFVEEVKLLNSQFNVGNNTLCLEIIESSLIEQPESTLKAINELKALGLPVAVDDFGTGYSSLTYLSQIRPDEVKIDQSFVHVLMDSKIDENIVESIIKLSHSMNAICIAEGVENIETMQKLESLGCQFGQGYYWAPPMPIEDFIFWTHEYRKAANQSGQKQVQADQY